MPAAAIPLAIGAAGAIASGVASKAGVGRNTAAAKDFTTSKAYDSGAGLYGGSTSGADEAATRYAQQAAAAQGRAGPQLDYSQADASRANMGQVANAMQARALGQTPSIAGQQAAIDSGRAMAQQAALASSARGGAAMALAGQQQANNTANAQAQISNQAQINAANERMAAEQAAAGAWANMRGQDAQQVQAQGQLDMSQRNLNDQYALGMTQQERAVREAAMNGRLQQQQMLAGSWDRAQGLNMQRNQANADRGMQFFQAGLGAVQSGVQGASMGGMGGGK